MTDDVMQLHIQDTALETASTFKLGRSYDEKKKQLSFKNGYIPVKQDVPLLESEPTISLAGFWGKSNGIPIKVSILSYLIFMDLTLNFTNLAEKCSHSPSRAKAHQIYRDQMAHRGRVASV